MGNRNFFGTISVISKAVLVLLSLFPMYLSAYNTLRSVEMGYNRLLLHFVKPVDARGIRHFVLTGNKKSYRYVFDLPDTRMKAGKSVAKLKYSGSLRSIRAAQYRKNVARIVIETTEPYAVAHYPVNNNTYIIILPKGSNDLGSSIKGLFAGLLTKKEQSAGASSGKIRKSGRSERKDRHEKTVSKSRIMQSRITFPRRRYRIILDPGHGGHDSGALDPSRRYREKKVVLQIGLRLRRHLKKMGFDVIMTRSSDRFIKLHRRTRYANLKHGDIFISIHANAVGRRSRASIVHGIETYYLSPARSARARRVAAKENSIAFAKYYKSSMNTFLKTLTRSKIVLSNKLAIDVQRGMLRYARSRYRGVEDGGVRPAPFWVLVGAEMPAILVETGYITHPREKKRLADSRYQDLLARGIAEGVARYLRNRERELG